MRPTGKGFRPAASGWSIVFILVSMVLTACRPVQASYSALPAATPSPLPSTPTTALTPYPTRPLYAPGELVDYVAQTGDSLAVLAVHFNTTVDEILSANSFIPANATTLPPGMPMKIPIYYLPFWGSPFLILPDSLFVNGPAQVEFDTQSFVSTTFGWLNGYYEFASGANRSGAQIIDLVATNFSLSPRLLLALLEYRSGALSQTQLANPGFPLGYSDYAHKGLYLQLVWAANKLNNGYYGWRTGRLKDFELDDGRLERPDPWQNAASVAIQHFFAQQLAPDAYAHAISPQGFTRTYLSLFGDPWQDMQPHIPGSLTQPAFNLPFTSKQPWTLTGGPHTAWGDGDPLAALDLAPPGVKECAQSTESSTAVAPGLVVRSEPAMVVLDVDGPDEPADGDERTGWVVFYLHIRTDGRAPAGARLNTGDPVGFPSCEGGEATGTHIHIARKYNGEWIPADSALPFNLNGWIAHNGVVPYLGRMTRFSQTAFACTCSDQNSRVWIDPSVAPDQ
jgi:hypothetical protein